MPGDAIGKGTVNLGGDIPSGHRERAEPRSSARADKATSKQDVTQ